MTVNPTIDDYIATQPEAIRELLHEVRRAIREALPEAEESISYGMPTYKIDGRAVIYFAGWKKHYSIYPISAEAAKALAKQLAPFEVEKGTVRFPLSKSVPVTLIARMAKWRAKEAAQRTRSKKS
ncbi:MAG: DUF1801 domain-containing protein [Bryobacteraceae bacterium]